MTDLELRNIWQQSNAGDLFRVSKQQSEEITKLKVQQSLSVVQQLKAVGFIIGVCWILLVDNIIIATWEEASPYFLYSALFQVLTVKLAVGIYLYQMVLISQVNNFTPVVQTQQKLAQLQIAVLWSVRVLVLQLPAWTTFYLHAEMFRTGHPVLLLLQVSVTLAAVVAAIWLFINIRFENRNKKWFKLLFAGKEWQPVMKAMEILEDSEALNNK